MSYFVVLLCILECWPDMSSAASSGNVSDPAARWFMGVKCPSGSVVVGMVKVSWDRFYFTP